MKVIINKLIKLKVIFTFISIIVGVPLFAQISLSEKDSLLNELLFQEDTSKSKIYSKLAYIYLDSSGNKAVNFSELALKYAQKSNNINDLAYAHIMLGSSYLAKSNYSMALDEFVNAEVFAKSQNNSFQLHTIYNNIGIIHKIGENYKLALEYYSKALYNADICNDLHSVIQTYNNIGNIYVTIDDLNSGLKYYKIALEKCESSDEFCPHLPLIYNNIGYVNFINNNNSLAMKSYNQAYHILDSIGNNYAMAVILNNQAEILIKEKKYDDAEKLIFKADSLHNTMGYNDSRQNLYYTSFQLYKNSNQYVKALNFLELHHNLKDSIYSLELAAKLSEIETKYEVDKVKLQNKTKDFQINQQKDINIALIIVIIIFSILLIFLIILFKQKLKLNRILYLTNTKLKEKSSEILSNLTYARKIQLNLMGEQQNYANLNYFVFDKPQSVVGGDFYLIRNKGDKTYIALADSTGHGISGGFLSVLGVEFLSQAIELFSSTSDILNYLNNKFHTYITSSNDLGSESMCISLICVSNNKVEYAGSKQKIWHYCSETNEIIEHKTNPQIIGLTADNTFTENKINIKPKDKIYLSSDGFPDQFDKINKSKYKYNRFRSLLLDLSSKDFDKSSKILNNELQSWKGDIEQTDDILVIGIKFS
ncbi:MAG: SpoIIE family protein phosphatase [Bacteroidales bacterium]|nr:SpoIIE family protein phosphatase [Bacteroidales bacterium]